jgi:flagellar assembly factor FliW
MLKVRSRNFGSIEYAPGEEFTFANGLPGFPQESAFLPIEVPEQLPLLYLQSLRTPELCFVALPVRCIEADYELSRSGGELASIGLSGDAQPGPGLLCLALVCFEEDGRAVANLRAPIVINVKTRAGIQMIQSEDHYPIRCPLEPAGEAAMCS